MRQLSLFHTDALDAQAASLASVMRLVRSAMKRVADEQAGGVSREHLADSVSRLAEAAGVSLTQRKTKRVSKDVLDKWLNPSAVDHAPSLEAVVAYCLTTGDPAPFLPILQAMGCEIMTAHQRDKCQFAEAVIEEKRLKRLKQNLEAKLL
ncbi:hypothetical protein [Oleidesulfovibrio sp.]|uniref:hypothetical protein n=1 Tax=Oleidesulfovibrio sp. TaxID=2909707 RepID=UPI003A8A2872